MWQSLNSGGPSINREIGAEINEIQYSEPVSVELAKSYARIQTGNAEDDIILLLIQGARRSIEKFTGLSLVEKTVAVQFIIPNGYYELPYGPVTNTPVFTQQYYGDIVPVLVGYDFPQVQQPYTGVVTANYNAGYSSDAIPPELKIAILDQFTNMYENRGDNSDTDNVCIKAQKTCLKYTRIPFVF